MQGRQCHPVKYISFIIKSIKTSFINFNSPQDVICGSEATESAGSGFQHFEDGEKLIGEKLKFYTRLLYPHSSDFGLFGILWNE